MPIKPSNKNRFAVIRTLLDRTIWPIILLIILATAGHLALNRQPPKPPPQPISPVPLPQTDWRGVDQAVAAALTAAHQAAAKKGAVNVWFYTTGKKVKGLKKVAPGRFALKG